MARPFKISFGEEVVSVPSVFDGQVEPLFGVFASGRELEVRAQMPKSSAACWTANAPHVYCEGDVLACRRRSGIVRVLLSTQAGPGAPAAFRFDAQQSTRVISDLLPALERAGTVTLDGALAERIIRRELKVRAYFDRENNLVLCRVAFLYGDTEIDPFAPQAAPVEGDERIMLLRDAAAERRALDLLAAFGFRMQKGRVILGGQEPIYRFLTEGIYRMQENAEVYCSDEFRKMTPRKPHFVGTPAHAGLGALRLEMTENGEPAPEVVDILARRCATARKQLPRLKRRLAPRPFGNGRVARDGAEAAVGSETGGAGGRRLRMRARRDGNRHLPRGVHDQPAGKRRCSRQVSRTA
ncbi:MAG: SNF2 helicase associated domain-containing protein [Christensenellales bacterium]